MINRNLAQKVLKRARNRVYALFFFFQVIGQFVRFKALGANRFQLNFRNLKLCLLDKTSTTGFDRHYVFHTAWASRVLAESRPALHVDISSSLYFVANVSAFVPVEFYDYRPAELGLSNLHCKRGDLLALPFETNSVASISCMHVVEHVGLGRYGDALDYDGDLKAAAELKRVVKPGGQLLFVVPMGGASVIQFNAHRIYTYEHVISLFPGFRLREFALIPDNPADGGLVRNAPPPLADRQFYGCGCFCLEKIV
jgi:SAM-dependent methyltransferase